MCCIIQSISVSSKHLINDCSDLTNIRLRKFSISACCSTVILNYGTCFTLSDPGYFKHLTIRGGGFKSRRPPPYDLENLSSISTISYMCILPGVLGMFQLDFFLNSRFLPFYSDFKIKSSENSCKNIIFVILFKIDFKYMKRRRILMRI